MKAEIRIKKVFVAVLFLGIGLAQAQQEKYAPKKIETLSSSAVGDISASLTFEDYRSCTLTLWESTAASVKNSLLLSCAPATILPVYNDGQADLTSKHLVEVYGSDDDGTAQNVIDLFREICARLQGEMNGRPEKVETGSGFQTTTIVFQRY